MVIEPKISKLGADWITTNILSNALSEQCDQIFWSVHVEKRFESCCSTNIKMHRFGVCWQILEKFTNIADKLLTPK